MGHTARATGGGGGGAHFIGRGITPGLHRGTQVVETTPFPDGKVPPYGSCCCAAHHCTPPATG
jgi:hypothetical protein